MSILPPVSHGPVESSARLRGAAAAELRRLERDLRRTDRRLAEIEREATRLRTHRTELLERLRVLNMLTQHDSSCGSPAATSAKPELAGIRPGIVLRGGQIREIAV